MHSEAKIWCDDVWRVVFSKFGHKSFDSSRHVRSFLQVFGIQTYNIMSLLILCHYNFTIYFFYCIHVSTVDIFCHLPKRRTRRPWVIWVVNVKPSSLLLLERYRQILGPEVSNETVESMYCPLLPKASEAMQSQSQQKMHACNSSLSVLSITWSEVRDNTNNTVDWLIAGYDQDSKTDITVLKKGRGGLDECASALPEGKAAFGGIRTRGQRFNTFIPWIICWSMSKGTTCTIP